MKIRRRDLLIAAKALLATLKENGGVVMWIENCKSMGIDCTLADLQECWPLLLEKFPNAVWPKCGHMKSWKEHRKVFPETYTVPVV